MIREIKAREILDSRGTPTVEVELTTDLGKFWASVPSGTSKGKYEAAELRDGGVRYRGLGVLSAVKNVNEIIAPNLKGKDPVQQKEIDEIMIGLDGTLDKSRLGANAILGVSLAVCRAGAGQKKIPLWQWISKMAGTQPSLPAPCILYIEGGLHGRGSLDIQEVMAFIRANSFKERLRLGTELYHALATILAKKYGKIATNVGLEGGFSPPIQYLEEALDLLMAAAKKTGNKIGIILDVAASTFFQNNQYYFEGENLEKKELFDFYLEICKKYPVKALEDPFAQDDWEGWQQFMPGILRIGDDLTVTNLERMKLAKEKKACGGVIIKPNQAGTVTETLEAAKYAFKNKWKVFVKHRSGETKDDFIADLAVGLGCGWIMAGAPVRGERVAKYNRLLKIEKELK